MKVGAMVYIWGSFCLVTLGLAYIIHKREKMKQKTKCNNESMYSRLKNKNLRS